MDLSTLPRTELLREVTDLIALHAELIDDDQLEAWPDLFVEDCHYSVLPRENADRGLPVATIFCDSRGMLVDRIVSLRRAHIFSSEGRCGGKEGVSTCRTRWTPY